MFHYRFLLGSIKCKIEKEGSTLSYNKMLSCKNTAPFFSLSFFLKLGTPLNSFTRILALLLPRSNISLDRKKSQFSTYLHENGVEGKVDSWEGLWGLKTLVDLGEQQADNNSTPSSNPNPQQQPFLLSGLSIDKIYWHVVQIKLIKARQKFIEMRIMLENICQPTKKVFILSSTFFYLTLKEIHLMSA